jgi:hypothetical protein
MQQHGEFKIWRDARVVCVYLNGSWNRETAVEFSEQFKRACSPLLDGNKWAQVAYFDDWELGVPEIEPVIRQFIEWARDNQLTHIAHVYRLSKIKRYQLNKMVPDNFGSILRQSFEVDENAFAWLAEQGFLTTGINFQRISYK